MGKSPTKWIKTVLFRKKSSKHNASKRREKVSNETEALVHAQELEADAALNPSLDSNSILNTTHREERKLIENKEAAEILDGRGISLPGSQAADLQILSLQDAPYNPERIKQEKAATKAQAVFRGFLARRAFRALKGILRLQALIRGHLVRRQAVATLCAMLGIVKMQALVRGRKVRRSDFGLEVGKKCNPLKLLGKPVDPSRLNLSIRITKLSANAFILKLLASSPTVIPLHLQYDSVEPNSVPKWLERWSAVHFWKPAPQPKKVSDLGSHKKHFNAHQTLEAETGRSKRSVCKNPAANVDSILVQSTPEFEKSKRSLKKVSSHPADPVHENPQSELEKVKRSLRKIHHPVVENSASAPSEIEIDKPRHGLEKLPTSSMGHEVLEWSMRNSGEETNEEITLTPSKLLDAESTPEPVEMNEMSDLLPGNQAADESNPLIDSSAKDETIPITNGEFDAKEGSTNNENHKHSRKTAVLAKEERVENGLQSSPSLPSYMAATESAKAKLRLQGSPRSGQDGVEKSSNTRRHSLPSSTNSKISSQSPRTHRLVVHAGGKNKGDKNNLSSREGNAKATQAEWRR